MKRLLWTLLTIALSTGVYFTIRYGLRPKPIPVLNPTEFENLEQLGAVIYKRLRQNVRSERLVLLGTRADVPAETDLWRGFLKSAAADGEKIVYFARPDAPAAAPGDSWETLPIDPGAPPEDLPRRVTDRIKAGQLVIVSGFTPEVTHLVRGSLGRAVERLVQHPVLSISTLPFALDARMSEELRPACLDASDDPDGHRRLGCAAQRVARKFARKALSPAKLWAVIERHGLKEYLVFVHLP